MGSSLAKKRNQQLFSGTIFRADPYKESFEEFSIRAQKYVKDNMKSLSLDDPNVKRKWTLDIYKREKVGHWFLTFKPERGKYSGTLELNVDDRVKPPCVILNIGVLNPDMFPAGVEEGGEVEASLEQIFGTAYGVIKDMGRYNLLLNNCQDFCKMMLSNLQEKSY